MNADTIYLMAGNIACGLAQQAVAEREFLDDTGRDEIAERAVDIALRVHAEVERRVAIQYAPTRLTEDDVTP